jgi:type II secretory pathway pseudopilin PulG
MVTVAIIAVLAAIAVPVFTREARKSKGSTEVGEVFAEFAVRQDQYRTENGSYLASAACPAAPAVKGQDVSTCLASGGAWDKLRVRINQKLYCSYEVVVGDTTGTNNPLGFTFTSPDGPWFYIVATCDLDGRSGTNSRYFLASNSTTRQVQNESK